MATDDKGTLERMSGWGWNAGAASVEVIEQTSVQQSVEWIAATSNKHYVMGLSHGDSSTSYNDIDFALFADSYGRLHVYEKGSDRGTFGTYAVGDKLEVRVQGTTVTYHCNGQLRYTSSQTPTFPLRVDTSFHDSGAKAVSVMIILAQGDHVITVADYY